MSKVDLIIPTYNRPELLRRILEYYNSYNVSFNIIIGDSSSKENKKLNKKIFLLFPKLKILYLDKFPNGLVSHHKFGLMVKYAKSKYVCFCADDDFIVPSAIQECIQFLEKNPDYSAAHGTYISFYVYKNPLHSKSFWWKFIYPYKSITSSNPKERLLLHLSNYYQVLWAVRRTNVVKKSYEEFIKSKIDPIFFGELLPDMLTLIYGKMKRLKILYAARQGFSTSYSYWPSLNDAINEGIYEREYNLFKKSLVNNLKSVKSKLSNEELSKEIDINMNIYLRCTVQEHLTGKVNLILRRLPSFFSSGIRLLHAAYLFSKDRVDHIGAIDQPSSKYFSDFDKIRKLL